MNMQLTNDRRGGLIIEVLLSIAVVMVFSAAMASLARANSVSTTSSQLKTRATSLARESLEQVYAIKQAAWADLNVASVTGTYVIVANAGAFELRDAGGVSEVIDGTYRRTVRIEPGKRDGTPEQRLTEGVGTEDSNVRLATVTVEWTDRGQAQFVAFKGYLTNWQEAT